MTLRSAEVNSHQYEDLEELFPTPRHLPRPHFEYNATSTPDVDLRIVPLPLTPDDLRSHPNHAQIDRSKGTNHANVVRLLGDSEVRNFTNSKLLDEDVILG